MLCRQGDHEVQTFAPERAQKPLAERVRLWALRRCFHDLEPQVADIPIELLGENAVAVMQQEVVAVVRWYGFAQLLERP